MEAVASDIARLLGAKLVSWDVDGTLYDKALVRRDMERRAFWRPWEAAGMTRLMRLYRRSEQQRERGGLTAEDQEVRRRLEARYLCPALGRVGLGPGVMELVRVLGLRAVPQVVLSDYAAEGKLLALGLSGRFARVYAAEDSGVLKPDPELLLRVARDFGVEPRDIVHIGDRPDTDGRMAEQAGAKFVLVSATLEGLASALEVTTGEIAAQR